MTIGVSGPRPLTPVAVVEAPRPEETTLRSSPSAPGRWLRAAAAIAAAFGAFGAGPASAQAPDQPGDGGEVPVVNSWALTPTGPNPDEPSSRPYLSYEIAPGATVQDSVTLWNYGNVQLTFRVYATDAFNNDAGDFDLLPGDRQAEDLGRWVQLPQEYVTVPAGSRVDLPFSLTVPVNAQPGDHSAAILASSQIDGVDSEGRVVGLDRRTGSRLYVRVDGAVEPQLTIDDVRTVYHPSVNPLDGSVDVTYSVSNPGNIRLSARQEIVLRSPFGTEMARIEPDDLPELLPGNRVARSVHFDGVTAAFRVTAEVRLTPLSGDPDLEPEPVSRGSTTWAVPWSGIGAAVLAVVIWRRPQSVPQPV